MPRKKAKRKLVEFTELEWELMRYLAAGGPSQTVLRNALLAFAKNDPKFEVDTFAKHLGKNVLPEMGDPEREAIKVQLGELRRYLAGDVAPTFDDHIDSSAIFRR
jgi:hypothetical protein